MYGGFVQAGIGFLLLAATTLEGLDLVRDGGRMVVCGHYTDNGPVEIHPHWQVNRKHVELRGCWGSRFEHFHRAISTAARYGSEKPWRDVVDSRYTVSQAAEALQRVEARKAVKSLIAE